MLYSYRKILYVNGGQFPLVFAGDWPICEILVRGISKNEGRNAKEGILKSFPRVVLSVEKEEEKRKNFKSFN